ncbi:MAG: hypothetical protein K0B15_05745 [Lentimicrobium sp.]|nr:hypothetical protein [Lentimicrobium sp.]
MKKLLLLTTFLLISGLIYAQKPITFSDDYKSFSNVEFPGIWVSIPEASAEIVQANWVKTIQRGTKSKPVISGQNVSLFGAIIKPIYDGPINIESSILSQDTVVMLFAGVELKRGEFITSGSNEYDRLKTFLKDFAKSEYIKVAEKQLSSEESKLKILEKELSGSRKSTGKFEKKIQSTYSMISKEEDNITSYRKQLQVTDMTIDNASSALSVMTDPDARKAKNTELKAAQKTKKGLMKKISSSENKISKANNSISDMSNSINVNQKAQNDLNLAINAQKMVINEFQNKLKTIKTY